MEAIMATASSQQVKIPLKNTYASTGDSNVGTIDLAVLTLDDLGMIRDCCQACEQVFGYLANELVGRHVSTLLPQLSEHELVQEGRINSRLAHLCHCAIAFQARHRDGQCFPSELFINRLDSHNVVILVRSLETSILKSGAPTTLPLR